jgi:hypothetical protein
LSLWSHLRGKIYNTVEASEGHSPGTEIYGKT